MPRRPRFDEPGAFHHVTVRGIERRALFVDDCDRRSFLVSIERALRDSGARVLAWSQMTNHVKRVDAPYVEGRTPFAVKTKFWHEQDLVVGVRLPSENSRDMVGALFCGEVVRGQLVYRCAVRTGFSERQKAQLYGQLRERKTPAFLGPPCGFRWKGIR